MNGDGFVDLIVPHRDGGQSYVYINDGKGGLGFTPVTFGNNKGTVYGFVIGDLDGDGLKDIIAARSDAPNVVYFGG